MKVEMTSIPGVLKILPRRIKDSRGFFVETFRRDIFDQAVGHKMEFVQENCSFSEHRYTVRGLHAQREPTAQGKLVSCRQGKIRDIVVDIRKGSKTYGHSVTVELSAENMSQLWVPAGFLHGFATLEANTEVEYKCTGYYAPECAVTVNWQDADLNLDWGFDPKLATLSVSDRIAASFKELEFCTPA